MLLYFHGGPGSATSTVVYAFTRLWADVYTIVTWDQRNCMKLLLDCAREKDLNKVELKATDDGYPVYKKVGFADAGGEYKAMVYKFQ